MSDISDTRKLHRSSHDDVRMVAIPDEQGVPRDIELSDALRRDDAVALILKEMHRRGEELKSREAQLSAERAERVKWEEELAKLRGQLPKPAAPKPPASKSSDAPERGSIKPDAGCFVFILAPLIAGFIGLAAELMTKPAPKPVVPQAVAAPVVVRNKPPVKERGDLETLEEKIRQLEKDVQESTRKLNESQQKKPQTPKNAPTTQKTRKSDNEEWYGVLACLVFGVFILIVMIAVGSGDSKTTIYSK